jgi:hypothetical protein
VGEEEKCEWKERNREETEIKRYNKCIVKEISGTEVLGRRNVNRENKYGREERQPS